MEEKARVIIKKVKKKSHEGAHGGSWKVAYADFVTAMMAFFLLLWLLAMAAPEQKASLSEYFTEFNVFESKSQSSGKSILEKSAGVIEVPKPKPLPPVAGRTSTEELARKMRASIDAQLQSLKNQVFVDATKEGVRIQIVDNEGSEIFRLGSDNRRKGPPDHPWSARLSGSATTGSSSRPFGLFLPVQSGQRPTGKALHVAGLCGRRELENPELDPSVSPGSSVTPTRSPCSREPEGTS
jgi:hypothetical protein